MHFQSETIKVPHHYIVTIDFRALNWTSRETYKTGEINSVETTRLTRTETRHDFLVHGDLLQASLRGCQGWDSVLAPQQTLFVEHSNIHHARFKTKLLIGTPCACNRKNLQGTCLNMNWCEVPLFSKSTIFEQCNKRSGKCFFEVKRKLLKYSICLHDEKNLKIKRTDTIKSRPLKIGKLGESSQLWYRKYTYLNNGKADWEIKVEK